MSNEAARIPLAQPLGLFSDTPITQFWSRVIALLSPQDFPDQETLRESQLMATRTAKTLYEKGQCAMKRSPL